MLGIAFIIALLLVLILSLIISKDLLAPTSILCLVFVFATACALYNTEKWAFSLTFGSLKLLLAGVLSFAVAAAFVRFFTVKRINSYISIAQSNTHMKVEPVGISPIQAYLAVLVFVALIALYFFYLRNTVGGFVQFNDIAYAFRRGSSDGTMELPFVARLAWNILRGLSIVTVYVLVRNTMAKRLFQNHGLVLIGCIILYGFVGLMSGERACVMRLVALTVIIWGVYWKRLHPTHANITLKTLVIAVVGFLLVLYGFSAIRFFVGRTMDFAPIDYISYYAGVPIYNFNYAISLNVPPSMDGAMTFLGLHNNVARVFGGEIVSVHRTYVVNTVVNLSMGNVYTFMYDYYHDFGVIGIIALTVIYSVIINGLYTIAIYRNRDSAWLTCLYAFVGTTLCFVGFTEQFFSTYIAFTTVEVIITLWLGFRLFGITKPIMRVSYRRVPNARKNTKKPY